MTDRPPYPWDDEHPPKPWSDEPAWLAVPKVNDAVTGDSVLADCVTRCVRYREMSDASKTTTAHECTHGINSQIRNATGATYDLGWDAGRMAVPVQQERHGLYGAGRRINGFYVLKGRGIALPEPSFRKRDVVQYIPQALRGDRFSTYVTGQAAWDDSPCYLWDEWTAYRNGAECGIEIGKADGSDLVRGPVEFQGYALAVLIACEKQDPAKLSLLLPFFRWHWDACWDTYQRGKDLFPFSGQAEMVNALRTSAECAAMREFCERHGVALPKG